jgi:predicted DNA-binding protein (MmcQ/YjbR family)
MADPEQRILAQPRSQRGQAYDAPPDLGRSSPRLPGAPGADEQFPFGPETSVFKVEGKIFALTALASRPLRVSLKCEPELAEQLRASYPAVVPGYHLNKRHRNTVTADGTIADQMVLDLIEDLYDLVVSSLSKARQRKLGL